MDRGEAPQTSTEGRATDEPGGGTRPIVADGSGVDDGSSLDDGPGVEDSATSGRDGDVKDRLEAVGVCLAAGVLGLFGVTVWGLVLGSLAYPFVGGQLTGIQNLLLSQPASGLGMVTGVLVYLELSDRGPSFLDVSRPGIRDLGYVVLGLVALFGALEVLDVVFTSVGVTTSEHSAIDPIRSAESWQVGLLVLGALVFIGPGEELLFRNVVQKRLYEDYSRYGAIVVASAIFGAIHYQAYATGTGWEILASLAVVATLSLLLGWLYHRTESVVVVAVVHGAYDAIVFTAVYLGLA